MGDRAQVIACDAGLRAYLGAVLDPYDPPAFWEAEDRMAALAALGRNARVLVGYSRMAPHLPAMLEALPRLEAVLIAGAGYDGIDPAMLAARGVALANCGDSNADDVADVGVGLALMLVRGLGEGDALVRGGEWVRGTQRATRSLWTLKAGVVGYGGIGRAIAARLDAFGVETRWWGPREKAGARHERAASLIELARGCDMLFVACVGGEETKGLVEAAVIEAVGPEGLIVNVARGSVVDEDALIAALKSGRLGGAGLDVFAQEPTPAARWADVPNVVLSPHRAGLTTGGTIRARETIAENIRRALAGEPLLHRID